MKILLSIKPEYAERILSREKLFEFRKSVFRNPLVKTVVIYATKPRGRVVGEFQIETVLADQPQTLWLVTSSLAGISKHNFEEYFRGYKMAYAIKIGGTKRYKEPLELREVLPNGGAPQSFRYLE